MDGANGGARALDSGVADDGIILLGLVGGIIGFFSLRVRSIEARNLELENLVAPVALYPDTLLIQILVAATIIKTISVDPSLKSMGFLAIMIVIRTMLGWTTVLEMTGRWPWQKQKARPSKS